MKTLVYKIIPLQKILLYLLGNRMLGEEEWKEWLAKALV